MPEFVFVFHDHGVTHDGIRQDLPDLKAARREAVRTLTELAVEELSGNRNQKSLWVRIDDKDGNQVLLATLEFEISKSPRE